MLVDVRRRPRARDRRLRLRERRDRRAPARAGRRRRARARLGAPGSRGLPARRSSRPCPRVLAETRRRPGRRRSASGSTSPPARCCRRPPTARRSACSTSSAREPARLGQALEAPRRAAGGRPRSTRSRPSAASRGSTRYGGKISSEWFFAKALQILDEAPEVYARADRLIEAADWVVWQLTGVETRNACTAGYKAMWSKRDGFPADDYFAALDPRFEHVVDEKMSRDIVAARRAGRRPDASGPRRWTGLRPGTAGRGRQRRRARLGAGGDRDRARARWS